MFLYYYHSQNQFLDFVFADNFPRHINHAVSFDGCNGAEDQCKNLHV